MSWQDYSSRRPPGWSQQPPSGWSQQDHATRLPPGWSQQDHATRPPPGWTRTPLYAELCALKQQVASLTDEKIQLHGCVADLRETVGRLGAEMSKMKRAFGALSNLVDAEVESCRGETSMLWVEATQAKESRVVTNQALERIEQSAAQQRSHDDVASQATTERIERAVAQVNIVCILGCSTWRATRQAEQPRIQSPRGDHTGRRAGGWSACTASLTLRISSRRRWKSCGRTRTVGGSTGSGTRESACAPRSCSGRAWSRARGRRRASARTNASSHSRWRGARPGVAQ